MITEIPLLDSVRVAAPCHADWNAMEPVCGERVRFCGQCAKNVYNLSEMTRHEAEDLIRSQEGRLCVRYYLRTDGTILTQNCPVGVRNARRLFLMRSGGGVVAFLALAIDLALTHPFASAPTGDMAAVPAETVPVAGGIGPAPVQETKPTTLPPHELDKSAPLMGAPEPLPQTKPEPIHEMGMVVSWPDQKLPPSTSPTKSGEKLRGESARE